MYIYIHMYHLKKPTKTNTKICLEFKKILTLNIALKHAINEKCYKATSSPAHLFAIRGERKRGRGTLQTRD